jgi:hypothetical protein
MVDIRKVVYSPSKGVFLGMAYGKPAWSRGEGVEKSMVAPTFLSQTEFFEWIAKETDGQKFLAPPDMEMREVWPKVGKSATSEDCGRAGLGHWHE